MIAAQISGNHAASYKGDQCDKYIGKKFYKSFQSGQSPFENSRFAGDLLTALVDSQRMLFNSPLSCFKTRFQI